MYLLAILAATLVGGLYPLLHQDVARSDDGFARGEAFMAGVFLAMALTLMLPSSFHLANMAFPDFDFPVGSLIVAGIFVTLLGLEHITSRIRAQMSPSEANLSHPATPLIMTLMIAVPSFFLGVALSVSDPGTALLIFIAIMIHKSSAAFALALKMIRSTLQPWQVWLTFLAFAAATPLGIIAGASVYGTLGQDTLVVIKATVLALAGGTFLYMAILHEHRYTAMIRQCGHLQGYLIMLSGFVATALVRLLIGEAHNLG